MTDLMRGLSEEQHALAVLEFPAVLQKIAGYATSGPGGASVLALRPLRERDAVVEALSLTDEMVGLVLRLERWSPPPIPEVAPALRRVTVEGAALDVEELGAVLTLLRSSRVARTDLRRFPDELPRLAALGESLARLPEAESRLDRSLDPGGGLSDSASAELARIRKALRGNRSALVRRLERFVRQLPERLQVPDASVTVRSGRYCVPVRREGMSQIGGIVHDESATHRTLFVEPPEAIEPMNRLAELERAEAREIQRILRDLTEMLHPDAPALQSSLAGLAEADGAYARARYALAHGGARPSIGEPETGDADDREGRRESYRAVDARHPLLEAAQEPVVPFHLELRPDERVVLISGPNAGGKTVLLKAIGLLSAMAQSGIIPPVGEGTRLPLFRSFHAMIGDEQSIQASLSTFSANITGLRSILETADVGSLVLIDELGGGTDPAEGGALAAGILLRLAEQAGLSVVTTHLGELKDLAAERSTIVNASLQFDSAAMRPTFRLARDRPGRSYALEIATRLGLPEDVLTTARSRLTGEERRTEALLKSLEEREAAVDRLTVEARRAARDATDARQKAEESAERVGRREREAEREARRRVERYLLEARQAVEDEIARLRRAVEDATGSEAVDSAVREARSGVERLLRDARAQETLDDERGSVGSGGGAPPSVGQAVRSRSLGVEGELLEIRGSEAVLEAGGMRLTLPVDDLEPGSSASRGPASPRPATPLPEIAPRTEIDLRGLRVDEVEKALSRAVDAAVVNDVPTLRIIHGKGTGALRAEVTRLLEADGRVRFQRPGGFQEGGGGVTVVEFARGGA